MENSLSLWEILCIYNYVFTLTMRLTLYAALILTPSHLSSENENLSFSTFLLGCQLTNFAWY